MQTSDDFVEVERYELREAPAYRFDANRRDFIQTLGAGLVIAVSLDRAHAQRPGREGGSRTRRDEEKLSDRFHIAEDGVVTVLTSKVEVGQGSRTQIAQAAAEELAVDLSQVRVLMADTELCPDDGGTAGSRTTPSTVPRVRNAAAAVRKLLIDFAARRFGVQAGTIRVELGIFSSGEHKISLAELVRDPELLPELQKSPAADVELKSVDQWNVLGKPTPKVNGLEVVTGQAISPSSVVRPGMLYGKVLRPASYGATLKSIDLSKARAMEGTVVVREGDFIGCAARTSWQAQKALDALSATTDWDRPPHPSSDELFEHLKRTATDGQQARGREKTWGDLAAALNTAGKKLSLAYTVAYIQHAPMEPRAAVAEWSNGKLTVRAGTQQPSRVLGELREAFQLPADRVRLIVPDTGGGFGGKHTGEVAVEAARLAKNAGVPVSLCWTREEEFKWAYFRPAGLIEVEAAIDDSGRISAWDFANYNSGGSAIDTPYETASGRTRFIATDSPLRQGSYRALASTANTFARESAMDELAELAEADPLEFRLKHLPDGRLKDVLQAAAGKFGWRTRRGRQAENHGVGIACGTEKGSFVAACAEVEVVDGQIKVLSICQAYECGAIQNPLNLKSQVIGAIIMGLGGALTEEIRFKDGQISNPTFSDYKMPRMRDVPELDIVLLNRTDLPSVGAGETPIIAVAPAIAEAVHQATGKRCRSMPMRLTGY